MKRLIFIVFVSIIAFIFYLLYTHPHPASMGLNLIFTIIGALVTVGIFTIAYFSFLLANTPWLNAKMVKDASARYFDLHIFNAGPGLAREVTWLLRVEDSPVNYLVCSNLSGIKYNKIDDFGYFQGTLQALSQNTGTLNVKGIIPANCKGKDHHFTVFIKYSKLIWVLKRFKYCQIRFSSEGKRLNMRYEISASEFKSEIERISKFSQELNDVCRNSSKASIPLMP
ncbi:MAG: hypothetical protein QXU18_05020 [Thermoplasmatales archaeon]